jgi:hypothetical protein
MRSVVRFPMLTTARGSVWPSQLEAWFRLSVAQAAAVTRSSRREEASERSGVAGAGGRISEHCLVVVHTRQGAELLYLLVVLDG